MPTAKANGIIINLPVYETTDDDDGGISVGDMYSFPPGTDYESVIDEVTQYLACVYAAHAHLEASRDAFFEKRVTEAAGVLRLASGNYFTAEGAAKAQDLYISQARAILTAIDAGLV